MKLSSFVLAAVMAVPALSFAEPVSIETSTQVMNRLDKELYNALVAKAVMFRDADGTRGLRKSIGGVTCEKLLIAGADESQYRIYTCFIDHDVFNSAEAQLTLAMGGAKFAQYTEIQPADKKVLRQTENYAGRLTCSIFELRNRGLALMCDFAQFIGSN